MHCRLWNMDHPSLISFLWSNLNWNMCITAMIFLHIILSLSIRCFWGKRGKMKARKGESWRRETPDTDAFTRPNFIYSNNTLLTAGWCEPELYRYLKHWYCLLCPGPVKPILLHSFGRSWYMRLFHTPRTSFLLTTRLWKHNSCSGFIFIPRKNLRAPSRAFLNSSLRLSIWSQSIYEKFQWLLLADRSARIYLRSLTSGVIVCYPITATSRFWMCHTICWMVLCQAFLSLPPPPISPI